MLTFYDASLKLNEDSNYKLEFKIGNYNIGHFTIGGSKPSIYPDHGQTLLSNSQTVTFTLTYT